jgi:hypothetical protein
MKTVIEMALHSGDDEWKILVKQVMKHFPDEFERFAELVRADAIADEREACAKVCEERLGPTATDFYGKTYAAAIRARSKT